MRWSFSGRHVDHEGDRCVMCGGEMVPERRIPGHMHVAPGAERRDATADRP